MADESRQDVVGAALELFLIVPSLDGAVDEAARSAVEIVEIVEGGVALSQALQRHRPPRSPAARLQRLLQRPDFIRVRVDQPDQPLGPDGRGLRDRLRGRKHRLQAFEGALPGRLDRDDGEKAEGDLVLGSSEPCPIRSGIVAGALERLRQHRGGERHRRLNTAKQRDEDLVGMTPKQLRIDERGGDSQEARADGRGKRRHADQRQAGLQRRARRRLLVAGELEKAAQREEPNMALFHLGLGLDLGMEGRVVGGEQRRHVQEADKTGQTAFALARAFPVQLQRLGEQGDRRFRLAPEQGARSPEGQRQIGRGPLGSVRERFAEAVEPARQKLEVGQPLIVHGAQLRLAAAEIHQRRVTGRLDAGRNPAVGLGREHRRLKRGATGSEPVNSDIDGREVPLEDRWKRVRRVMVSVAVMDRALKLVLVVDEYGEALPAQAGVLDQLAVPALGIIKRQFGANRLDHDRALCRVDRLDRQRVEKLRRTSQVFGEESFRPQRLECGPQRRVAPQRPAGGHPAEAFHEHGLGDRRWPDQGLEAKENAFSRLESDGMKSHGWTTLSFESR